MQSDINQNILNIRKNIEDVCKQFSRDPADVTFCAVSKTKPVDMIKQAVSSGVNVIGENYVQEVVQKFVPDEERNFTLRFIGHLQSNKVAKIIPYVDSIDSVDSLSLLKKINSAAEKSCRKKIEVLFEFNSSQEINKSGFRNIDEVRQTLDCLPVLEYINFNGMMTMGPVGGSELQIRHSFEYFNNVFDTLMSEYDSLTFGIRSFGMSGDYKIAVEMGSTMIRIGTAVFGGR